MRNSSSLLSILVVFVYFDLTLAKSWKVKHVSNKKSLFLKSSKHSHLQSKRQFLPGSMYGGGPYSQFNGPHVHRIFVHHHPEHSFCQPEPCQNGATCTVVTHGYECTCPQGFMGTQCELRSQCEPNPCKNAGTCYDVGQGYECTCAKGFKGDNCEDINKCHPNPCRNGGMCTGTNNAQGYQCTCREGFKGTDCQEINICLPSPCKNGGTCTERAGGRYECTCPFGFKGVACEERSICFSSPCLHGGTCVDEMYGYRCTCRLGYNGVHCQNHVCSPSPCHNGGTCLEEDGLARCVCQMGYHGLHCEMVSSCVSHPCLHGGTCIDTSFLHPAVGTASLMYGPGLINTESSQSFYCKCVTPYAGTTCEDDRCKFCSPHAECIMGHCVCKELYHGDGKTCKKNVCHPNPCKNGATCVPTDDSYDCDCVTGWTGPNCESRMYCIPNPCQNGGTCVPIDNGYKCTCLSNYEGNDCEKSNPCSPNPCKNGGTCREMNNAANCDCGTQYDGKRCEIDKCAKCDSHASCKNGRCKCNEGYVGDGETCVPKEGAGGSPGIGAGGSPGTGGAGGSPGVGRTSACASNPCQNGGACFDTENGFTCQCQEGFTGTFCELGAGVGNDPCNPNPCKNGGTCRDEGGKAVCTCPEGFEGPLCENAVVIGASNGGGGGGDGGGTTSTGTTGEGNGGVSVGHRSKCHPNPCLNGGICHENGGGYDCVCLTQYSGPNCEIDECEKCDVNAICIRGNCRCRVGYIGNGYECEKENEECDGCSPNAHCMKGVCVCVDQYIGNGYHCQPASCVSCPTTCSPSGTCRSTSRHKIPFAPKKSSKPRVS